MKHWRWLLLLWAYATHAQTQPPTWQLVGQGSYQVLWLEIYDARLYSPDARFTELRQGLPLKLELCYQRDIKSADIVDATADQWRKLYGQLNDTQQQYLQQLRQIWPDVKQGDCLAMAWYENGVSEFWYQQTPVGRVEAADFGQQFLAIWLDVRTSAPALRRALIGQKR